MDWDRQLMQLLINKHALTREQAGAVVGIVAEERQIADLIGYKRGLQKALEIQKQGNARFMVNNV